MKNPIAVVLLMILWSLPLQAQEKLVFSTGKGATIQDISVNVLIEADSLKRASKTLLLGTYIFC